jgi:endoglucanase
VPPIKIDTVGYATAWRKIAVFNVPPIGAVVKDATGRTVLALGPDRVQARGLDTASQDQVWQVDLSELRQPGTYVLACQGGESEPFVVGDGIYDHAVSAALKSFYFQRSRTALLAPYAVWQGKLYGRPSACHVHDDVGWDLMDYPHKKRRWKVERGWHDAGNYDLYVPSQAPAAQALLQAYEWAPERFPDGQVNNPESGNGVPDILDEVKWGLAWVLSMQEPGGAFRHRESVVDSSPHVTPDRDRTVRWIAGVSTAATAKAVAALALAARLYPRWDRAFAERCADAARRGWRYLEAHPKQIRADLRAGGGQPLWDDEPENTDVGARFAAAAEVWRTFRAPPALERCRALCRAKEAEPREILYGAWANISRSALATLALDPETPAELRGEARAHLLAAADILRPQVESVDGYRCASELDDYYWAHNSNLLEKAHILALAARLEPERGWALEAARDQWHWVLGRNPTGYSMITRVGRGPTRFYHLEWGPIEPPPPGYLVGGPNSHDLGFLSPGAPAKALLWDNPRPLRSGLPPHSLWHWRQSDLWDGGFVPEGKHGTGWWAVTESDILYSANVVLTGVSIDRGEARADRVGREASGSQRQK